MLGFTKVSIGPWTLWESAEARGVRVLKRRAGLPEVIMLTGAAMDRRDLEMKRKLANVYDDNGHTPLHLAAREGNIEKARDLLSLGAKLQTRSKIGGLTALHFAVYEGKEDMVALLIHAGASTTIEDDLGITPLRAALSLQNRGVLSSMGIEYPRSHPDWGKPLSCRPDPESAAPSFVPNSSHLSSKAYHYLRLVDRRQNPENDKTKSKFSFLKSITDRLIEDDKFKEKHNYSFGGNCGAIAFLFGLLSHPNRAARSEYFAMLYYENKYDLNEIDTLKNVPEILKNFTYPARKGIRTLRNLEGVVRDEHGKIVVEPVDIPERPVYKNGDDVLHRLHSHHTWYQKKIIYIPMMGDPNYLSVPMEDSMRVDNIATESVDSFEKIPEALKTFTSFLPGDFFKISYAEHAICISVTPDRKFEYFDGNAPLVFHPYISSVDIYTAEEAYKEDGALIEQMKKDVINTYRWEAEEVLKRPVLLRQFRKQPCFTDKYIASIINTDEGRKMFFHAVTNDDFRLVGRFLKNGFNANIENELGQNPLDLSFLLGSIPQLLHNNVKPTRFFASTVEGNIFEAYHLKLIVGVLLHRDDVVLELRKDSRFQEFAQKGITRIGKTEFKEPMNLFDLAADGGCRIIGTEILAAGVSPLRGSHPHTNEVLEWQKKNPAGSRRMNDDDFYRKYQLPAWLLEGEEPVAASGDEPPPLEEDPPELDSED